jgi:hypothetical protein
MTLFETETMAELCIKQGLQAEGFEIYRRLVRDAPDELTRARRQRRLAELERILGPAAAPAATKTHEPPAPALELRPRGEEIEVAWSLPAETRAPALQLLFVRRTPEGVETEARTLKLAGPQGRTVLPAPGLHSVRAAAGRLEGERFVPLARASAEPPAARRV